MKQRKATAGRGIPRTHPGKAAAPTRLLLTEDPGPRGGQAAELAFRLQSVMHRLMSVSREPELKTGRSVSPPATPGSDPAPQPQRAEVPRLSLLKGWRN